MKRITEPELMDDDAQALAYAQADFEQPHHRFIEYFQKTFPSWPGSGLVLDLGCGPGDIAMRFARAYPSCRVDGIDGAPAMLNVGTSILNQHPELAARVRLHLVRLPEQKPPETRYDTIISNSLLHHLHDPGVLWNAVKKYACPGCPVFIVDLMRPDSPERAEQLTRLYVAGEAEVLRRDFYHSLRAAFTVDEIRDQLAAHGLSCLNAAVISDRHVMVSGYAPGE